MKIHNLRYFKAANDKWTREKVYDLIAEKKKAGWDFVFLGADVDAYQAGHVAYGIDADDCATYRASCTGAVIGASVARATASWVADGRLTGSMKDTIDETAPGALVDTD